MILIRVRVKRLKSFNSFHFGMRNLHFPRIPLWGFIQISKRAQSLYLQVAGGSDWVRKHELFGTQCGNCLARLPHRSTVLCSVLMEVGRLYRGKTAPPVWFFGKLIPLIMSYGITPSPLPDAGGEGRRGAPESLGLQHWFLSGFFIPHGTRLPEVGQD